MELSNLPQTILMQKYQYKKTSTLNDKDSHKENRDKVPRQRSISVLPPRRERTRAAMLRKAKSEAAIGLRKISESYKDKEKEQKDTSRADEAAKIYYTSVLQTEKTLVKDGKSKTQNDPNISLIGKYC